MTPPRRCPDNRPSASAPEAIHSTSASPVSDVEAQVVLGGRRTWLKALGERLAANSTGRKIVGSGHRPPGPRSARGSWLNRGRGSGQGPRSGGGIPWSGSYALLPPGGEDRPLSA